MWVLCYYIDMAKKKNETEDTEFSGDIKDAFKILDDLNPDAQFLDENTLSTVKEWIDTGCMALNAIISGSLYGGIPMGRIIGFAGPQACGKTLMVNKIMANAQKKGMHVVYFDTENALDKDTAESLGCDPAKIKHCPIEIIEECRNQLVKFLKTVVENKLQGKVMIAIDSLGNLISAREAKVIEDGKDSADMGARAVSLKSMLRAITHAAAKANCPIVFTNHTYDNPGALYPTLVKSQSGGSGPLYMSSVLVQMATKQERVGKSDNKNASDETTPLSKDVNGLTMRALTTKNRFVPPFLEAEMYLNFRTGISKYSGLLEMAEGYGVITKQGHRYVVGEEVLGFYKDWKDDDAAWAKVLPKLEEKLQSELKFKREE
ncbi:AAA family ATPase [bacterium]|nr:AAA family ATPase [bacterium]